MYSLITKQIKLDLVNNKFRGVLKNQTWGLFSYYVSPSSAFLNLGTKSFVIQALVSDVYQPLQTL